MRVIEWVEANELRRYLQEECEPRFAKYAVYSSKDLSLSYKRLAGDLPVLHQYIGASARLRVTRVLLVGALGAYYLMIALFLVSLPIIAYATWRAVGEEGAVAAISQLGSRLATGTLRGLLFTIALHVVFCVMWRRLGLDDFSDKVEPAPFSRALRALEVIFGRHGHRAFSEAVGDAWNDHLESLAAKRHWQARFAVARGYVALGRAVWERMFGAASSLAGVVAVMGAGAGGLLALARLLELLGL